MLPERCTFFCLSCHLQSLRIDTKKAPLLKKKNEMGTATTEANPNKKKKNHFKHSFQIYPFPQLIKKSDLLSLCLYNKLNSKEIATYNRYKDICKHAKIYHLKS